jgi:hypothetical protein
MQSRMARTGTGIMGLHSPPTPGRPAISARQAARLLRRDARTVQRMIRDGEIEGGHYPTNQRQRWFVYSDQLSPPPRPTTTDHAAYRQLADDVEALRSEVAAARAEAATAQETSRLLLASQGILLSALDDYRQGSEEVAAVADDYRHLIDRHHTAAAHYRGSADQFAKVLGNYRDIIGQAVTPGDLSSLSEEGTRP